MALTCRLYREGKLQDSSFDPVKIGEALGQPDVLVWLDIEGPTEENMALLGKQFGFHELALEDCLHPHQRPKVEQYGTYFFLVAYGASVSGKDLQEHELAAFVGAGYLVTVRKEPVFDMAEVVRRWDAHSELHQEGGGYLLYILLDEMVDGYFSALELYEDLTEEIEDKVFGGGGGAQAQADIFRVKKELITFRRSVAPLRDVLDVMQRRTIEVVTERLEPYYRDVYDHVLRTTDFVDSIRDILSSALEAHLAVVSNRLNEVMKVLTSWAAIILIPTLIAGIYGMNFVHMPELRWRFGYLYALVLMFGSATMLYRIFKRRGWL